MPRKIAANGAVATVHTQKDVERFEKAAEAYGRKATASKKKARETLVALGIYTKSGRLTKNYRSS